jgi:uncharacterized 2Fe-2S/4Fe-4S cluster protein (DUF4445 family)
MYDGDARNSYGLAVDIGTTVISFALYRMNDGQRPVSLFHELNRQSKFGADVLSRIASGRFHELHCCINEQLKALLHKSGIAAAEIFRAVFTGNATMLYLLMGWDPAALGRYPFMLEHHFGEDFNISWLPGVPVYLPACASAFIGADAICSAIAVHLLDNVNTILIDIGTNGEILLHAQGQLLGCSVAAGPAFEGAEISMGMPALPGAIDKIWFHHGEFCWHSLPGAQVRGICGSGLLSALRCFVEHGMVDDSGKIQQAGASALQLGNSNVAITQTDIRKLQLAKAAVAAGIDTLLHESGRLAQKPCRVYLAGGFGSYLNPEDAAAIGMIPFEWTEKVVISGNSALQGAVNLLFSSSMRTVTEQLAKVKEVSLGDHAYFQQQFLERLDFPENGKFYK